MHALWKEILAVDTGRKALRSFGWLVGAVLVGLATVVVWRSGWTVTPAAMWLGGIGAALVLLGLTAPVVLRPVYRVWMALAVVLGFVMTRVILTLVYFIVVTPTALIFRLAGRDSLSRRPDPSADSYWIRRDPAATTPERLEKYY